MPVPPARSNRPRAVARFLHTEAAGGIVLLGAALASLLLANSPWHVGWEVLWSTELTIRLGRWALRDDLRHWVNDGLMALFFFVVGLEIKRELVAGALRDLRIAAVPAVAALGGMALPALLYAVVTVGGRGSAGWGIPMATDIAFAVGVVALLGSRVPPSLRVFLLTLAIVDDIGAIVVIAVFYADGLEVLALGVAAALVVVVVLLRRAGVQSVPLFAVLGVGVWLATYRSGVHATIAGVVLGLLTPARAAAPDALARDWAEDLSDEPTEHERRLLADAARSGVSVAERLQHQLHPLTSFAIVPVFALANAGVRVEADALSGAGAARVAVGVATGLVAGKLLGVWGATWLAVRTGLGRLPEGAGWRHVAGVSAIAGIGFTVSLFVAGLAFDAPELEAAAKLGILAGSVLAAILGATLLLTPGRRPESGKGGQPRYLRRP